MNLNQITFKSKNVNRAVEFYQKLGLRLIVDASPRYVRFELPEGDTTLSISYSESRVESTTVTYFEVKDVVLIYQRLKARGFEFKTSPQRQRWRWTEARLTDPDGHPLVLFSAGNNRKNPPWKLPEKQWFESLCESPYNLMK